MDTAATSPPEAAARVLLIGDNPGVAVATERFAETPGSAVQIAHAATLETGLAALRTARHDAVVLDLDASDARSLPTLAKVKQSAGTSPVVVVGDAVGDKLREELIAGGAADVLSNNEAGSRLLSRSILHALERNRAHEQQRQLERVLDVSLEAIVVVDPGGTIRYANDAALRLFERSRSDFMEEPLSFPVKDGGPVEISILNNTAERRCEVRAVRLEWWREAALLASIRDITEIKRQARLRSLLSASPDTIIIVDGEGRITLASPTAEPMFGYRPEELVGQPIDILIPERLRSSHAAHLRRYMPSPGARGMGAGRELLARRKDGKEFPVEISLNPDRAGEEFHVIAAVRDITDRKTMELQLRQTQKMEAVGNLTGGMAHDFNNLLGIVVGNLDLLIERGTLDKASEEFVRDAIDAAMRGADLIQRLLAFARRQPLRPHRIDLNELIARTTKLLRRALPEDIEIVLEEDHKVWPVVVDPVQLEASLVNVVNNARDAMPKGGKLRIASGNRHLEATTSAGEYRDQPAGDFAMIEISDNGTGMAPEVLQRAFEPFFTTKELGKGTGLGLSMVFGFIKQSGGHTSIYSELGLGTTVRLYLPRAETGEGEAAESRASMEPRGHECILAVEDNVALRRVVASQLQDLGYRVLEAENAAEALSILERESVDLLFSDVVMPGGMSGYDLAKHALSRWPAMKVVVASGFPELNLKGDIDALPSVRLLGKPYRKGDLARALREVLDG